MKYIVQAPLLVYRSWDRLMAGTYKSGGFHEFDIFERGKARHIRSVPMSERVVQRCLCDNSLVPVMANSFIYDNSASLEGKGYHFAIRRIKHHLRQYYRKYGQEGYILLFDFSKFFDNVSHKIMKAILRKEYKDSRLLKLLYHFIDCFGDVGMGLGSQISQTLALASANRLDHAIKEKMRIKFYARYMDDGYLIHKSKEYLHECLEKIRAICADLGIKLNEKKCQIIKLSHGFTWLKCRFYLTETGKVVCKIYKRSVTKMRQKIKKLKKMMDSGKIGLADVKGALQSWMAYALHFDACNTVRNIIKLTVDIFGIKDGAKIVRVRNCRGRMRKQRRYTMYATNQILMQAA